MGVEHKNDDRKVLFAQAFHAKDPMWQARTDE